MSFSLQLKPGTEKILTILWSLPLILMLGGTAEARNPQESLWMKNLSYTANLEPPEGIVWRDEFGDMSIVGTTVHALWYGLKNDWSDRHFVYRRSTNAGVNWATEQELISESAIGGTLVVDESAKYFCATGNSVHFVIPVSFPANSQRNWHYGLYYYRSTDNGQTFEPGRLLVDGADIWHITQPRIACNTQRVVIGYNYYANWYNNSHIRLLISDTGGNQFRKASPVDSSTYSGSFEDLVLVGTDAYILHHRTLEPAYYGNFQARIGLTSSIDDAHSFRTRWLSTKATDSRYYALGTKDKYNSPDLAVVGSNVYVLWNQLDTNYQGTRTLMFRRSTDKGNTFELPRVLYKNSALSSGQETLAARGNYVYVIFPTTDSKVHFRRSDNQGTSFQPDQIISTEGGWWPEIVLDPRNSSGAAVYAFWDSPTYRYSTDGGAHFDNPLWLYQAFSSGSYQRSHRRATNTGVIHLLTSASYTSASVCGGICDFDIFYRRAPPDPNSSGIGQGLRLYTYGQAFEDRADNMQVLAKTLNFNQQLTVEVWVKDLGGGIGTGYTDYRTPILFKQRDLKTAYNRGFSLGTMDYYGKRGLVAEIKTAQGDFEVRGQDAGLLDGNVWTHLAMTYNAGLSANNLKLYKNGQLVSATTATGSVDEGIGNLFVGRYGNWIVDDVRIWSRTLPQSEIQANMSHPLTGSEANLQAYFTFENTTRDVTGHGNDGLFMYKERYVTGKY